MKKKLVQFGAGNIGRSFIGQVFSRNGYEVVFIDIDEELIDGLNREGKYRVILKDHNRDDRELRIENVRAVHGGDREAVKNELRDAAYISTSVGKGALRHIFPVIAAGLQTRHEKKTGPVDIIIAENIRNGAEFFFRELKELLPPDFPLEQSGGLVETSIGKMVPIMREEDKQRDPLWVFAEPYNTLILDKRGFLTEVPSFPEIKAVENITAYVDRKLFIHNMGHAAAAYLGYRSDQAITYIWGTLENRIVYSGVKAAMEQAGEALHAAYPDDLSLKDIQDHIEDLLSRFQNRALGDTVYRVGRDLRRKLAKDDRLIGAMLLCDKHKLPFDRIAEAAAAAFSFRAADETGAMFPGDREFHETLTRSGPSGVLTEMCGLDPEVAGERTVMREILKRIEG